MFIADAQLVCDNAKVYNPEDTIYYKGTIKMERVLMGHGSRVCEISWTGPICVGCFMNLFVMPVFL